ncbi:MAG: type IV pilus twitching motility protein PilT [Fusobacteriaceae bacterium]
MSKELSNDRILVHGIDIKIKKLRYLRSEIEMDELLRRILVTAKEMNTSDIHFIAGLKPTVRTHGELKPLDQFPEMNSKEIMDMMMPYLVEKDLKDMDHERELDFAFTLEDVNRYRANLHMESNEVSLVLRALNTVIPDIGTLKLPPVVSTFANFHNGLVLVTGATGSGKSTTLAALIDQINKTRAENIITIEDPIEYVYSKKKSLIRQREVGRDTPSFARALKGALRQDPDVILVGELRDLSSIESALTAAETGHLVFGTLHTNGAAETIDRIVDVFPEEKQHQIRIQLSSVLRAVVSQDLIKSNQGGRIVAAEVLVVTKAASNLILSGKTNQIASVIETGGKLGMQTMGSCLKRLYDGKLISREDFEKRQEIQF